MATLRIFIWGKFGRKGGRRASVVTPSIGTDLPLSRVISEMIPAMRKKYPHNWITVHTDDEKLERRHESPPIGFTKKAQLDKEIKDREGITNRYGELALPVFMHRPGKGKKKERKRAIKPKDTSKRTYLDYRDLTKAGLIKPKD